MVRAYVWWAVAVAAAVVPGGRLAAGDDPAAPLRERERRVRAAAERVARATVIDGTGAYSGVVVTKDGYVLTAAHNFDLYQHERTVRLVFPDGRAVTARRLGRNRSLDLGLLKITDPGEWPHAELADPPGVRRGDWCLALGHPGGYDPRRPRPPVRLGRALHANPARLLTACAIYGGDSGGPLADLDGRVIGVHSGINGYVVHSRHAAAAAARADWDRLARGDRWGENLDHTTAWPRPALGAALDPAAGHRVVVGSAADGSPAAAAGLRAGDELTALDGEPLTH